MGAYSFKTQAKGKTARDAFHNAVSHAQWESGHRGYTGTIAEKHSFTIIRDSLESLRPMIATCKHLSDQGREIYARTIDEAGTTPQGKADAIAEVLMGIDDNRITDKWGPAGCIEISPGEYLFFGYASS